MSHVTRQSGRSVNSGRQCDLTIDRARDHDGEIVALTGEVENAVNAANGSRFDDKNRNG